MRRPDKIGIALLQSLHILREMENKIVLAIGGGRNVQESLDMNPHHYYAWGLFKKTLLEATKNRPDLKAWSPELFRGDIECTHCQGKGKLDIPQDSPRYREYLADDQETQRRIASGEIERTSLDHPFYDGDPLYSHCTPCQGSGILTELDQVLGK